MTTYSMIEEAETDLKYLKETYLRRFGWTETCRTPGSLWLWVRDFPQGRITAPLDLAVRMTVSSLDDQAELGDDVEAQ